MLIVHLKFQNEKLGRYFVESSKMSSIKYLLRRCLIFFSRNSIEPLLSSVEI